MTLAEAVLLLGDRDPTAMRVVYEELRQRAPRVVKQDQDYEDILGQTLINLVTRRPWAPGGGEDLEERARRRILKALKNAWMDFQRKRKSPSLEAEERVAWEGGEPVDAQQVAEFFSWCEEEIVAPAINRLRADAARRARRSWDEMLQIYRGTATIDDLATQTSGAARGEPAWNKARNRVYQDHCRTRRDLLDTISILEQEAPCDKWELARKLILGLKRGGGSVRCDRGGRVM